MPRPCALHSLTDLACRARAATLVVAVIAPAAVSLAVAGLDRRADSAEHHRSTVPGTAFVVVGVALIAALIDAGLYTLFTD